MFRPTRRLLAAVRPPKATTDLTGVAVHPDPLPALKQTYTETLSILSTLPPTAVYRQATEALTKHKAAIVDGANGDVHKVEDQLGMVEKLLIEAKGELKLAGKMLEWKGWESLQEEPPKGQWRYFEPGNDPDPESMPR